MSKNELQYWLAFTRFTKIGSVRFKHLYTYFPDMKTAWLQGTTEDYRDAGLPESIAEQLTIAKPTISPENELALLDQHSIQAITVEESHYPSLLKEIYAPPAVLFYKGDITKIKDSAIAIVGPRKMSDYGRHVTQELVRDLAQSGLSIISGLALGVDAQAHITALDNNAQTVAVLGSGLDKQHIYPTTNRPLADRILNQNGIIVSEYPIGTLPLKYNFPARNRIISGLSLGTVVIEAGESSGSLITAKNALEQNREVFAVPGNITNQNSLGTNKLIQQGAHIVTSSQDILDQLKVEQVLSIKETQKIIPESPEEEALLPLLSKEPIHVNKLVQASNMPAAKVNSSLTIMELKGKIKNIGNMHYVLAQ